MSKDQLTKDQTSVETQRGGKARPQLQLREEIIQEFGTRIPVPLGLDNKTCEESISSLNLILADLMVIYDMYRKAHWQTSGQTFYQLHLLFEKHYNEISELVDEVAERIQILGGVSVSMPQDVIRFSSIDSPPSGRESVPVQLSRLVEAHEILLKEARKAASEASDNGDEGTNDLLISGVVRTNEMQTWFIYEHLVALNKTSEDLLKSRQ